MEDINVQELKERLDNGEKIEVVDVREEWEYDEINMGAKNIPLGTLPQRISELEHLKDTELVVHCKSGRRSDQAKKYMQSQGFNKVRNLLGGIDAYSQL
ncbi:MAG: rhodanese-like domain-containing protein [Bacteroidota bacterium]